MQKFSFKFLPVAVLSVSALVFSACQPSGGTGSATAPAAGDTAATVNGKAIKMEAVEKVIKAQTSQAQAAGQELRVSPLELAAARMQILQQLIQQEVMYQKAEAEKTIPTDEEVNQQFNKMKTESGKSAEEIAKQMQEAGETEESVKEGIKRDLAVSKLIEKITGKVDAPKDSEIEAFYKGNPEAFVLPRGVKLGAIIIDPAKVGEGDTTTNEAEAVAAGNAIIQQLKAGADFTTLAREKSEDQSRLQGGDLGYISEQQLAQLFPQVAPILMNEKFPVGQIQVTRGQDGRFYILKLQERSLKEETQTLETPGVRQKITDALIANRKEILRQSYATIAMNEAKIENYLAKKIVENPNELSGARPASSATPPAAAANTNSAANTNANAARPAAANTNANAARPAAANAPAANTTAANTAGNKANTGN